MENYQKLKKLIKIAQKSNLSSLKADGFEFAFFKHEQKPTNQKREQLSFSDSSMPSDEEFLFMATPFELAPPTEEIKN